MCWWWIKDVKYGVSMNVYGSVGLWFFIGVGVWIGRGFVYGVYSGKRASKAYKIKRKEE